MDQYGNANNRRYIVTGAQGQLGYRLIHCIGPSALPVDRTVVDLANTQATADFLNKLDQVDGIFNAAAYTPVDLAETERTQAQRLNVELPAQLAQYCHQRRIPLVHYSTDYVFSGAGETPWQEEDQTLPLNYYGQTKRDGELAIVQSQCQFLIFRTSWVYDSRGKNFVRTIMRLAQEREELKIVADQVGAPTWARDLAEQTWSAFQVAQTKATFPSGIYHCSGKGETSWFHFAKAIVEGMREPPRLERILPITTKEYPTPAQRPKNSRLNNTRFEHTFGVVMPDWGISLREVLKELAHENS